MTAATAPARLRRCGAAGGALLALLATSIAAPAAAAPPGGVVLRFLSNEGFAIEAAGKSVFIDAIQTVGQRERGELPGEVFGRMLARKPPFRSVALVLVSHPHSDHFDADATADFMKRHPETVLASSPGVVTPLRASPLHAAFGSRLRELGPPSGTFSTFTAAGIRVTWTGLPHIGSQIYPEQVLAHLVEVEGKRILHVGDAEMADADLEALDLRSRRIDVAILPYWAFVREGAPDRLARLIGARKLVAMRLPIASEAQARQKVTQAFPEAIILTRALETVRL